MNFLSRSPVLAPFRVRSFRFQWPADLAVSWAFEMEMLILGWYVLVETGSVLMLTLYGALLYPGTLIAPMIGVVGDRIGQRNLLCGMRAIYATLAAVLMILALTGLLNPTLVLVIAGLVGLVRPSDQGIRAALVADTMPPEHLVGAMAISRTTTDTARVAGALTGAGLFAALGLGPAYIVVTGFHLMGVLLTFLIRRAAPVQTASEGEPAILGPPMRPSPWRELKEGLLYVWNTPQLLAAVCLACLANLIAFPLSNGLLPYVARAVYQTDQTGLGYLVSTCALGALAASIGISIFSGHFRSGRMMLVFAALWYAVLLVFAQTQSLAGGLMVLVFAGVMQTLSLVPVTVVLLRTSGPRFRGRVMGVRMLAIYSLPIGLLAAGALIEHIGFRLTAMLYASVGLLLTGLIALRWHAHLWPLDAPANTR